MLSDDFLALNITNDNLTAYIVWIQYNKTEGKGLKGIVTTFECDFEHLNIQEQIVSFSINTHF